MDRYRNLDQAVSPEFSSIADGQFHLAEQEAFMKVLRAQLANLTQSPFGELNGTGEYARWRHGAQFVHYKEEMKLFAIKQRLKEMLRVSGDHDSVIEVIRKSKEVCALMAETMLYLNDERCSLQVSLNEEREKRIEVTNELDTMKKRYARVS